MNSIKKRNRTDDVRHLEIFDLTLRFLLTLLTLLQAELGHLPVNARNLLLGGTAVLQLLRLLHGFVSRRPNGLSGSSLSKFSRVIRASKCPFARKAKLMGRTVALQDGLTQQVEGLKPMMIEFTDVARKRRLDGVVIEITAPAGVLTLPRFCSVFNSTLRTLAANDPVQPNCFAGDILEPNWQFSFNGMRFFVTTFAPFYDLRHPRFSHAPESAFIYLQPEFSFDQHGIHSNNPQRESVKAGIRRDFLLAGYHLDVSLIEQPHEAFKYIKPLSVGDAPIRWWETKKRTYE